MNNNNPNVNEKDDDLDLSSIINEYEEDSVLRQKIEKMKQQKAQEEAQQKENMKIDSSRSALVQEEEEPTLPKYEDASSKSTFLDVDDTINDTDKTREINVNGEVNHDVDKTLVIMDNQQSLKAASQTDEQEEDESILVYANHEVDEEEITEEDIEEFLGEEEAKKKAKKEMDPKKMNKVITYVISGVVALCLLIGVGFGVKYAMDSFVDDEKTGEADTTKDKDKTKDTNEDKDKDKETNKGKDTENTDPSTTDQPSTTTTDNSVRKAEINGSIKANNEQINALNDQISNFKNKLNALGYKEDEYIKASTEQLTYTTMVSTLTAEQKTLQDTCDALTKNPEEGKDSGEACQQAVTKKKELDDANQKLNELNALVEDYKAKKDEYTKYNNAIATANTQITDLNNRNTELQKELNSLQ